MHLSHGTFHTPFSEPTKPYARHAANRQETLEELRAAIDIEALEQEIKDKPKRGIFSQPALTPTYKISSTPRAHDIRVRVAREYRRREGQLTASQAS